MIAFIMRDGTTDLQSAFYDGGRYPFRYEVEQIWLDGYELEGYKAFNWRKDEGGIVRFGPEELLSVADFFNADFQYPESRLHQFGDPK